MGKAEDVKSICAGSHVLKVLACQCIQYLMYPVSNICILLADHSKSLHNQLPSHHHSHKASYSKISPKISCHGNDP